MAAKALLPLAGTALVLCYPFLVRWALPLWPATPPLLAMLPPAVIDAWLAWIFGRTLAAGCEPLISTFARLERAQLEGRPAADAANTALPPEIARYTRTLTVLWTALLAAMAGTAFWLAAADLHDWWAWFTGVLSYLLIGALFFGEYVFRRVRFAGERHAGPLQMILSIAKAGPIWARRP